MLELLQAGPGDCLRCLAAHRRDCLVDRGNEAVDRRRHVLADAVLQNPATHRGQPQRRQSKHGERSKRANGGCLARIAYKADVRGVKDGMRQAAAPANNQPSQSR